MDSHLTLEASLSFLYAIMSLAATVHILLNKTDPKSALLWISLVWFSPFFGVCFYLLFGINRISRRAKNLVTSQDFCTQGLPATLDDNSPDRPWENFRKLGTFITGSEISTGNSVSLIEGAEKIHRLMMQDISFANNSILISTYIFKYGDLGKEIATALIEANRRGVDVKVVLDGFGNGFFRSRIFRRLLTGGVDVRRFLHSSWPWRMPYLNLRNHRKLLIIDGKLAYTGSMNIGSVSNLETQLKIEGPIAAELTKAFEQDWILAGGSTLGPTFREPFLSPSGMMELRTVISSPLYRKERLRWALLAIMGTASQRIRIVTPYFIPDQGLISGLILAAYRGVKVEVILPRISNYIVADWASNRQIEQLVEAGCKIFYRADVFDHSKIMTVDSQWALMGSSNWDARSLRLNFELDVECFSPEVTNSLDSLIDQRISKSVLVMQAELDGRPLVFRIRNALARLFLPYL